MIPKFRVWDKDKKWMVYDVQDAYDGLWSERNSDEINDYYSYVTTFQSFTDEERFNFMQYTGLKDKNGKEIYEGDIVAVADYTNWEGLYKVAWDNDGSMYVIEDAYGDREKLCEFEEYLVKGNIHDNPELLEVSHG